MKLGDKATFIDTADGTEYRTTLLSWTTDMQCWSWSLPAMDSCPMAYFKIHPDGRPAICDSCYAVTNRYGFNNVAEAQWKRYIWTIHLLQHDRQFWIQTMAAAIDRSTKNGFFRGHDSGDFFQVDYIDAWHDVCRSLPHIKFWFPTRAWTAPGKKWKVALARLHSLDNVIVRPSALHFDHASPDVDTLGAGSSAHTTEEHGRTISLDTIEHKLCPKSLVKGASCESTGCRSCWDGGKVSYYVHGHQGRHVAFTVSAKIKSKRAERANKFKSMTISVPESIAA